MLSAINGLLLDSVIKKILSHLIRFYFFHTHQPLCFPINFYAFLINISDHGGHNC